MRQIVNEGLTSLDADFDRLYAAEGRPSIAPERLLRASLIQILFSVRSEQQAGWALAAGLTAAAVLSAGVGQRGE